MKEKVKRNLQEVFNDNGYENCEVLEVHEFTDLFVLECVERIPLSKNFITGSEFTIIFKGGVYLNSDFDDLEEMYHRNSL